MVYCLSRSVQPSLRKNSRCVKKSAKISKFAVFWVYSLPEFLELVANVFFGSKMCWGEIWYMDIRFDVLFPTPTRDFPTEYKF